MVNECGMVHIMMATYNGEKYIQEQLDSILQQTYTEWKLYISDDGSADHTRDIIRMYEEQNPERIILLESDQKFRDAKKNFAFLYKCVPPADYYAFCDQDDVWENTKLECMIQHIHAEKKDRLLVVYHDMEIVTANKEVIAGSFVTYFGYTLNQRNAIKQILLYNVIPGCSMLFNNEVKRMIEGIPESCVMHDWWIVLVSLCLNGKIIFCGQPLSQYRQHDKNQIGAIKKKKIWQMAIQCVEIWKLPNYIKNNQKIKMERIRQTETLLHKFAMRMDAENRKQVEYFLKILTSKRRVSASWGAISNGYIFLNKLNTLKFFLL